MTFLVPKLEVEGFEGVEELLSEEAVGLEDLVEDDALAGLLATDFLITSNFGPKFFLKVEKSFKPEELLPEDPSSPPIEPRLDPEDAIVGSEDEDGFRIVPLKTWL